MRALILVCVASACGRFGFAQHGGIGDSGADGYSEAGDGGDDAPASGCASPTIGDPFDETVPCAGWGIPLTINATVTTVGGNLNVSIAANVSGDGGCQRDNVAIGAEGVFAEVVAIAASGDTSLTVSANPDFWEISSAGGTLLTFVQQGDSMIPLITYDATAMRWWRIRQVPAGTSFETSPDGVTWIVHRTSNKQVPATARVAVHATTSSGMMPSVSQFGGIDVCP